MAVQELKVFYKFMPRLSCSSLLYVQLYQLNKCVSWTKISAYVPTSSRLQVIVCWVGQHSKKGIVTWTYFLSFEMCHNNTSSCSWWFLLHGLLHIPMASQTYHSIHTIKLDIEQFHTFLRINNCSLFGMWRRTTLNCEDRLLYHGMCEGETICREMTLWLWYVCGGEINDSTMVCLWRRNDSLILWWGRHVP